MKIEILGMGCPKCKKLTENAEKAVAESGVKAEVVKVEDMDKIVSYGIMMTPALAVDGKVMCCGKIATVDEIKKWIC
ncbi:MAG: thioredoxin family protein [Candidatus Altiarchaeota archaeon]|nr:thioredoxin family protein [Candidatus Altiarchaeota archaeon]